MVTSVAAANVFLFFVTRDSRRLIEDMVPPYSKAPYSPVGEHPEDLVCVLS
jgi:hypothetical protein